MSPRWLLLLLAVLTSVAAHSADRPALVVLFSIDQMREDYFERFHEEFTGGLGRFYRDGVFFSDATLNYAASETGPGHATLLSGYYPAHSGIIGNGWIDPGTRRWIYCVEDSSALPIGGEGGYRSPKNLLTTSLGDWLKAASPSSKVISISAKDRAAILMGGRRPDWAFWYQASAGHMVSSSYYGTRLPDWVVRFNQSDWVSRNAPLTWEETDAGTPVGDRFVPHVFKDPASDILTSPWGDYLLLDFAKDAIGGEHLGQRGVPDLLCISLSATDYVGHTYGPHSEEMHDHMHLLDIRLGTFIDSIEQALGAENVLFVLSADHGVLPLPEYLASHGNDQARRINTNMFKKSVARLDSILQKEFDTSEPVIQQMSFLNYRVAAAHGVDSLALEQRVRKGLQNIDGVEHVYFRRELLSPGKNRDPFADNYIRSFYSPRSEDFQFRFCEWCLLSSHTTGTSHGSPYEYDTHVPIVFLSGGIGHRMVGRPVHTVDIAPTLGVILHAAVPKDIDGVPLTEIAR